MQPAARPSLASLWLNWLLANATAVGTAYAVVVMAVEWTIQRPSMSSVMLLASIPGALGLLFLVGYAQQFVLRPWIAYVDYWALMMPAKLLTGVMLAFPLTWFCFLLLAPIAAIIGFQETTYIEYGFVTIAALWFGFGVALLQVPYLCLTRRGGWLWLGASAVGVTLGIFAQQFALVALGENSQRFSSIGGCALLGAFGGATYGAVTGAALVVLMKGHAKYPVRIGGFDPRQRT